MFAQHIGVVPLCGEFDIVAAKAVRIIFTVVYGAESDIVQF